jgi:hypothetical protein
MCERVFPKNEIAQILASLLLADGFRKKYEAAVVISNDSDLMLPIMIVTQEPHLPVGLLNPHPRFSVKLSKVATFKRRFARACFAIASFPTS